MEKLNDTLLYTLDKCFRTYHQFSQRNVRKAGYDITITGQLSAGLTKTILKGKEHLD